MKNLRRLSLILTVVAALFAPSMASASTHAASSPPAPSAVTSSAAGRPPSRLATTLTQRTRPTASASASAYTQITGTAVSGVGRWPNAHIGYWQWTGSAWAWQGYVTTANSAGNYSFYVRSGYYYFVEGEESYRCSYYGGVNLWGTSVWFGAGGGRVNAQVTQNAVTYYGSGCP